MIHRPSGSSWYTTWNGTSRVSWGQVTVSCKRRRLPVVSCSFAIVESTFVRTHLKLCMHVKSIGVLKTFKSSSLLINFSRFWQNNPCQLISVRMIRVQVSLFLPGPSLTCTGNLGHQTVARSQYEASAPAVSVRAASPRWKANSKRRELKGLAGKHLKLHHQAKRITSCQVSKYI